MNVLVIDGETCETKRNEKGRLDTSSGQVYDLGGMVLNVETGEVLDKFSLVNMDVFVDMPQSMAEAYFADKIPQYWKDLADGKRKPTTTWGMRKVVLDMCEKYGVAAIVAHNAWFDVKTLNSTIRYQTKSKRRYFLPYGIQIMDTMRMAEKMICADPDYVAFCEANGYMTAQKKPRPRKTAEVLWRYLSGDNEFVEEHTGLADVEIESKIFMECVRRGYALP